MGSPADPTRSPGYVLRPIVIGFEQVPRITDHAQARAAPQLAVLSAIAHRDVETAEAARAALDMMSEEDRKRYWAVIVARLPPKARRALEACMRKAREKPSDLARKYYLLGLAEGRREGMRLSIISYVRAWLPRQRRLHDELAHRLREQPYAELVQLFTKLAKVSGKDSVRAVIDRFFVRRT